MARPCTDIMSNVISHLVIAGGRGVRMFGQVGGCKALLPVDRGVLLDYCIRELPRQEEFETLILTSPEYEGPMKEWVDSRPNGNRVDVVSRTPDGTGAAVAELLSRCPSEVIVLTTCDIAGPDSALRAFYTHAIDFVRSSDTQPACVVAVAPFEADEDTPINVHFDPCGTVSQYSKQAPRSGYTFASARVMNSAFAAVLLASRTGDMTDTNTMERALLTRPGSIRALLAPRLFDVDTPHSLTRARSLYLSSESGVD